MANNIDWTKLAKTVGQLGTAVGSGLSEYNRGSLPNYYIKMSNSGNGIWNSSLSPLDLTSGQRDPYATGTMLSGAIGDGYSVGDIGNIIKNIFSTNSQAEETTDSNVLNNLWKDYNTTTSTPMYNINRQQYWGI